MSIGEIIKGKREELRLSQTRMALRLGISSQLLGHYEKDRHRPKLEFLKKWKELFHEDLFTAFVEDENKNSTNLLNEDDHEYKKMVKEDPLATLYRIIEKQQETIHFLTTGRNQGTEPKKTA